MDAVASVGLDLPSVSACAASSAGSARGRSAHSSSNSTFHFPGWVTYVGDDGPPELRNVLEGWAP